MPKVQEWLFNQTEYNSTEKRKLTKKIIINEKGLEGKLDLREFPNLEKLECAENKLEELDARFCVNRKEIYCRNNKLTSLVLPDKKITYLDVKDNLLSDYSLFERLSPDLVYLDIRDNIFNPYEKKDPSFVSRFESLETLRLGRANKIGTGF